MKFKCVWLIDDDPVCNFLTENILNLNNFAEEVHTFTHAEDALTYLDNIVKSKNGNLPDIIFLDINMPGLNGWDFLEIYRNIPEAKKKDCDIYMLSSSVNQSDIQMARESNEVKDFISKPLSLEDLEVVKLQKAGEL